MNNLLSEITKSLKLKTQPHRNLLSITVGEKRYDLPFETRLIMEKDYAFIHIPPSASIVKLTDSGLEPIENEQEVKKAWDTFKYSKRRGIGSKLDLPEELQTALQHIPKGYKIAYDANGIPRIVKSRRRRSSKR